MMRLRWTEPALSDIERIYAWHASNSEQGAVKLINRLRDSAESLATLPMQGRPGRIRGTRELVVSGSDYLILYQLTEDAVELLRVIHTRQQWPPEQR